MNRSSLLGAALLAMAWVGGAAAHDPAPSMEVVGFTPDIVAAALKEAGLSTERKVDDVGDPLLVVTGEKIKAEEFLILFYNCEDNVCEDIGFSAWFSTKGSVSVDAVNGWNEDSRFVRGYVDREGDAFLEMDVDATDGIPKAQVTRWTRIYLDALEDYGSFLSSRRSGK